MKILAIDVGGTGLKAALIDSDGKLVSKKLRVDTPHPCPPKLAVELLVKLVEPLKGYGRIAVGFPGVVRGTKVITAPHFDTEIWHGFDLGKALTRHLKKPVRMINDADMQGLGAIKGKGLEMVITLGTGFGSALFRDGDVMPHMELAHHPIHGKKTYDEYLGDHEMKKIGKQKWNKRLKDVLPILHTLLNFDRLYIGGGNAKKISFKLPRHVTTVSNVAGIEGGAKLWRIKDYK